MIVEFSHHGRRWEAPAVEVAEGRDWHLVVSSSAPGTCTVTVDWVGGSRNLIVAAAVDGPTAIALPARIAGRVLRVSGTAGKAAQWHMTLSWTPDPPGACAGAAMLTAILAMLSGAVPLAFALAGGPPQRRRGTYAIHPAGRYGPVWRGERPPGLPAAARPCSATSEARVWIEQAAEAELRDPVFIRTVLHLAKTESGQMFGRPANNYDNRPEHQRPEGKGRISAWGCFQWNEGAGRDAGSLAALGVPGPGYDSAWQPHHMTAWEEISGPVRMYGQLWRAAILARGTRSDAARLVRMWHRGSGWGRQMLERAQQTGDWSSVYQSIASADDRGVIDRHLRDAGVLT